MNMKRNLRWLIVAGLLLLNRSAFSQNTNLFVFLCFGQSNMEGFPGIEPEDKTYVDGRLQVLAAVDFPGLGRTEGHWYTAIPPLCRPSSGLCPADYFGRTMVSNLPPNVRVGIVNVSVAGCKIELFEKDAFQAYAETAPKWMTNIIRAYRGNPYQHLVDMAKLAQKDGVIKGILLHQGESNTNDKEWPKKVSAVYESLLKDLNLRAEQVPLLVGEVVSADQHGACASMNAIIDELPQTISSAHVISSKGCTSRPDHLHFTPAGYRELGRRYAFTMLSLMGHNVAEPAAGGPPPPANGSDISGTWKSKFDSQIGEQKYTFTFKQDGSQLTGKAQSEVGDRKRQAELKEGHVDGDKIKFVEMLRLEDNEIPIAYSGKLSPDGNEIRFTREVGNFAKEEIVARRVETTFTGASTTQIIRIKAGASQPVKDADGNTWLADQGFEGGQTIERPDIQIANTKSPDLYRAERYSMGGFSYPVPNGKYLVKLHFAETFEGITGPGERVFSFNVQGHEFKDFDVWVKAGGPLKAYVETVPVEVTGGVLKITFTPKVENPQINAIEIMPQESAETSSTGGSVPAASVPTPTITPAPMPAETSTGNSISATPVLQIDAGRVTGTVSPTLYGLMTEEINFSYEGGIYGELIRNRSFKANAQTPQFWSAVGSAAIELDTNQPLNAALNLSLKLDAARASKTAPAGVANGGFWGIPVRPHTKYRASFYARGQNFAGPLTLSLESAGGNTVFAGAVVSKISGEWRKYEATLKTGDIQPSKENRFVIRVATPGTVWLQNVSLFPPTYHNRPNGTRPDIMRLLADMQPKFLRFPGGNYLEGNSIAERFNWKETIGDVAQRPGHRSPWGYWSTDGFGLLEFLEWCEDLRMQPVLALYAGYSLRGQHVEPGSSLEPFVEEALEEIEYVIGDRKTKWGAQRAKDGHPQPFKLTYVEVGNEDWFDRSGSYEGRFAQFYDAIKAKYPNLQVISTMGYEHPEQVVRDRVPDLVDEHYYRSQEEMQAHALDYDKYSRTNKTKIFCGEWATRVGSPTPNMAGALGDAAWMTGMERNSDIVLISCYAPLLVNVSQLTGQGRSMQWSSDLIGYDALTSYGSPSYYAQRMFSTMHGDQILATTSQNIPMHEWQPRTRRGAAPAPHPLREIFFNATRDSRSGSIYLKVVNEAGTPRPIRVQINGCSSIRPKGEAVVLTAARLDDTNALEHPERIVPRTDQVDGVSGDFTREFPPYSITVLKLKTKQ